MKKVPKSSIDPKASIPLAPKLRAVSTHSHHFRKKKKTFFREILRRYNGAGIPGSSTARKNGKSLPDLQNHLSSGRLWPIWLENPSPSINMERKPQLTQVAPVFPASHLDLPTQTTPLCPSNAVKGTKHHSPAKNRPRGFS